MAHESRPTRRGLLIAEPDTKLRFKLVTGANEAGFEVRSVTSAAEVMQRIATATSYDSRVALPEAFVIDAALLEPGDVDLLAALDAIGSLADLVVLGHAAVETTNRIPSCVLVLPPPVTARALLEALSSLASADSFRASSRRALSEWENEGGIAAQLPVAQR